MPRKKSLDHLVNLDEQIKKMERKRQELLAEQLRQLGEDIAHASMTGEVPEELIERSKMLAEQLPKKRRGRKKKTAQSEAKTAPGKQMGERRKSAPEPADRSKEESEKEKPKTTQANSKFLIDEDY